MTKTPDHITRIESRADWHGNEWIVYGCWHGNEREVYSSASIFNVMRFARDHGWYLTSSNDAVK